MYSTMHSTGVFLVFANIITKHFFTLVRWHIFTLNLVEFGPKHIPPNCGYWESLKGSVSVDQIGHRIETEDLTLTLWDFSVISKAKLLFLLSLLLWSAVYFGSPSTAWESVWLCVPTLGPCWWMMVQDDSHQTYQFYSKFPCKKKKVKWLVGVHIHSRWGLNGNNRGQGYSIQIKVVKLEKFSSCKGPETS